VALEGLKPSRRLSEIFKRYPQLRKAWDRGRFLRNLRNLARTGASVSEAAKKLGFANGRVLRTMIDEDEEVEVV
jgi:AraC-like DNA-binding protein